MPLLLAAACAGSHPADANEPEEPMDWSGPPVRAVPGEPPVVEVQVPTGGYELRRDEDEGGAVRLTLTSPGEGELVTEALETLRVELRDAPAQRPLEIRIAQQQRGVHYFVPPPHELAAVLRR
jgi:hypothetical protein